MRPRNDMEREALALSEQLPPIWKNESYTKYLREQLVPYGKARKDGTYSPSYQDSWGSIPEVHGEWQVVRIVYMRRRQYLRNGRYHKAGESSEMTCEFLQYWTRGDGRIVRLGANLQLFPYFKRFSYSWGSPLSVKDSDFYRDYYDKDFYEDGDFLPVLEMMDIRAKLHRGNTFDKVLSIPYSHAETLYARGMGTLADECYRRGKGWEYLDKHWASIRIALKHGYGEHMDEEWLDHVERLEALGHDCHNPVFLCPVDFEAQHHLLVEEKARLDERRRTEAERMWNERETARINKAVQGRLVIWDGFSLSSDTLDYIPLITGKDYKEEGRRMHHCVAGYASRDCLDTLILSARNPLDGKRVETVEVDLHEGRIVQSRAVCNGKSDMHEQILSFVNQAIPLLQERVCKNKAMALAKAEAVTA